VVLVACGASREIVCKLQCKLCGTKFGPANPSGTANSHFKPGVCKKYSEAVAKGGSQDPSSTSSSQQQQQQQQQQSNKRPATGPHQQRIDDIKGCREKARECLAMFFFTNSIALSLMEDPWLKRAFGYLNASTPTR